MAFKSPKAYFEPLPDDSKLIEESAQYRGLIDLIERVITALHKEYVTLSF